jgi:menaquinone-dependent protoporphyrinogen oxidase
MHIEVVEDSIAIVYATWHGQAEKVARRIADVFYAYAVRTTPIDLRQLSADSMALERYDAVIVVGSVHFGRHSRRLVDFVRRSLAVLSTMSTAFLSVSNAAGSLEGDAEAQRYIHEFVMRTGWQPDVTVSVAGAIPYTRYGFLMRHLMAFTSRLAGRDSDSTRDFEYTNWFAVEDFARNFLGELGLDKRRGTAAQ